MREDRLRLVRAVESASAEMERRRKAAARADKGQSVESDPPCPLPDNKEGFKRYVGECWTGQHQPEPAGYREFVAYLDAVKALSSARFRLGCFERAKREG